MADKSAIIDAIAAIGLDVTGINSAAVYGPGGGTVAGVKELPDDIGVALPAFLMLAGDGEVISGNWERQTWTLVGEIWVDYTPRGVRYRELVDLQEPVLAAFRAKSKGGLADTAVQSVLFTGFDRIEGRKWSPDAANWYLVMPFTVEVKVNRAVTYLPA
jgi:hypothetical protein